MGGLVTVYILCMREWQNKSPDRCAKRGISYKSLIFKKKMLVKMKPIPRFQVPCFYPFWSHPVLTVQSSCCFSFLTSALWSFSTFILITTNVSFQNRSLSNTSTLRFKRKQNHKVRGLQFFDKSLVFDRKCRISAFLLLQERCFFRCHIPRFPCIPYLLTPLNANSLTGLPLSQFQFCFPRDPYPTPLELLAP